jgi:hypothetical protein
LTVSSTALRFEPLVSFCPCGASSTTGFVPLACVGSSASSRSVAAVELVPGSDRLLLVWRPAAFAIRTTAIASAIHATVTA